MRAATFEGDPLDAPDERTSELDFAMMARAVWARKFRVLVPAVLALIASALVVQLIPPEYKSTASILLQSQESSFTRPLSEQQQTPDQQAIDDQAVGSQVQLLKSRDIARQAVKQLSLVGNPEFDPLAAGIGPIKQMLMSIGLLRNPYAESPEDRVLDAYFNALTVYPMDKSRVLTIEFASRDPDLAARAANTIADIYIAMQRSAKRGESQGASDALSPQIEVLRGKVATAEAAVEAYRTKNGLFIAQNNASLSSQQLGDITTQLSAAQSQETEALAKADLIRAMIRDGRPVEVSDVSNNETVRRLVEQRAGLLAQLALEQQTLLPGHPRIKELKAQLAALEAQIGAQAQKAVRTLENDANLAKARVQALSSQLDRQKSASGDFNENEVQLRALEREAKAQRDLLESYLSRFREASARASFPELPADARIISRAVPASEPYFPKKLPIIAISTLAALILSLAFLVTSELLSGRALVPAAALRRERAVVPPIAKDAAPPVGPVEKKPRPAAGDKPAGVGGSGPPAGIARPPATVASLGSPTGGSSTRGLSTRGLSTLGAPSGVPSGIPPGAPSAARVEAAVRAARAGNTTREPPTPWPSGETPSFASPLSGEPSQPRPDVGPPAVGVAAGSEPDLPAPAVEPLNVASLVTPPGIEVVLADLVGRCRRQIGRAHSLVFTGTVGRSAISTAASDLGRTLSADALRVVLVDLGPGTVAGAGEIGLGDLLAGAASFADIIERDGFSRMHLMPAGRAVGAGEDGTSASDIAARLAVVAHALSLTYDVVLFDAGPLVLEAGGMSWKPILPSCEAVIGLAPAGEDAAASRLASAILALGASQVICAAVAGQDRAAA